MKVLHVIAGRLDEGAAKGAYILHEALLKKGVDSYILTNSQNVADYKNVETIVDSIFHKAMAICFQKMDNLHKIFYSNRPATKFSIGFFGFDILKSRLYSQCDIIHLHWVCNGFIDIKHLKKIDKPIFWSLRDMWPMTGGCHYALECQNFKTKCGECPQLNSSNKTDLSTFVFNYKGKNLNKDIHYIGLSEWITNQARQSSLLKKSNISTIPNGINTNNFEPIEKEEAKNDLDLTSDKPVLLIGAINLKYPYKGASYLPDVLNEIKDSVQILIFGRSIPEEIKKLNISYKYLGYINQKEMVAAYSASDLYLMPSVEDTFPKTVIEAMSCKIPIVCFDSSGPKEIVDHMKNGYKAKPYVTKDLIEGVKYILSLSKADYAKMCRSAREKVVNNYDINLIADQYVNCYEEALKR